MKVLVVEDNVKLASYIVKMLEDENYSVEHLTNGFVAEQVIKKNIYDLVILDLMLPDKDGILVCKSLRDANINVPILMLTARSGINDKIAGLDAGADDYLVKPFNLLELRARVSALLRRPTRIQNKTLEYKDLRLDTSKREFLKNGKKISLTSKEFALIEYFLENVGLSLSRDQITQHCWGILFESQSNIVDAYIKKLRSKIETKDEKYFTTIRGFGYKLE